MDLKAVEEVVSKIQGAIFKNSNSYSIGMLKSHFRGSGLQFKEHQVYCHGDDVRFIDWKLTAKANIPYIKTFEEERNVEIFVVIDLSKTMLLGFNGVTKLEAAIHIASLLSLIAQETNDYVTIALFGNGEIILPKGNGKKCIVQLISELRKQEILKNDGAINLKFQLDDPMSPEKRARYINKYLATRKEVVILSDFNSFLEKSDLAAISTRRNTHSFRIISPLDKNIKRGFSVFAEKSNLTNKASGLFRLNSKEKDNNPKEFIGKRIHTLDLESRYMEDFVKVLV